MNIPSTFQLCFNDSCPRSAECLRHRAGTTLTADRQWGPAVYPTALQADGACRWFKQVRVMHGAWGFDTLFADVKRRDDTPLRSALKNYLGGNGTYYLYHNGKKLLTPEQQEWILNLFRSYGYTENLTFDGYRDEYDFNS